MTDPIATEASSSARRLSLCAAALLLPAAVLTAPSTAAAWPFPGYGDISTFASVPADPGFPEGIAVRGNRVYVSAPATFGTAGTGPSTILVYRRTDGSLLSTIEVEGEDLSAEHALSGLAFDDDGRLYALSTQLGLIRFDLGEHTYAQEPYGDPFPNQPTCVFGPDLPVPCSLPNDIAFDEAGFAYVTDSLQATIFRVPPGGGAPEVWFQSPLLQGSGPLPFGPNGIRLDPHGQHIYFAATTSPADPSLGFIYRLPLIEEPTDADLEVFHTYDLGEGPDGLAFGLSGKLYVSLAQTSGISVLAHDGDEVARIESPPDSAIPLDSPATLAFDSWRGSLLVANHAVLSGDPEHFAVLKVFVGDFGAPLETPCLP